MLVAASVVAGAGINTPGNPGDLLRARLMLADKNYTGCVDRLDALDMSLLSPAEVESVAWLRAAAEAHLHRDTAISLLREFIDTYPASVLRWDARMLLADCLLDTAPAEALELYLSVDRDALDDTRLAGLDYHTAYALMRLGELDRARDLFLASRADSRLRANADFYLGYIAYTRHDYAEARRLLGAADRSSMPGCMADYYLSQINYVEGDYDAALAQARAIMDRPGVEPQYTLEAARIAGESMFQLGDRQAAIPYLRRYVDGSEAPERSAMYILGTAEYADGNYAGAVDRLEHVTSEADAMGQSACLYIGQALMERGERDAAVIAFEKALRMDFDRDVQEAAFYNYAVAKMGGARVPFGSAAETFEEYLRRYPEGRHAAAVQEYLVAGYLTDSDYEGALRSIRRMSNPGPKVLAAKQQVLYALGTRALSSADTDAALAYLREADGLSRHDRATAASVSLSLGEALYRAGRYAEAVKCFEKYLSESPASDVNRPLGRYDLGYALFALKDYAGAGRSFSAFIDNPGRLASTDAVADAVNRMGDTRFLTSDFDGAEAWYTRSYDNNPSAGDYPLFRLAVIKGYRRDHKGKIADINSLLDRYPSSSLVPDALLEMTESYIQLGDNRRALDTYRRLVADYPNTEQGRRGYLQMALTMLNTGDRAGAIDSYREVVMRYPTSEEARMAVDELKRIAADDGTLGEFGRWLGTVDNAPRLDVAEADRLTFDAAEKAWLTRGDTSRLERYLTDFPEGSERARALGYMMEAATAADRTGDALTFATTIVENYPDSRLAEQALIVKAEAEYQLGRGGDALRTWSELEGRASSPRNINIARTGIMRVARDRADYPRVLAAAEALLASSTPGSEERTEAQFSRALALDMTGRTPDARRQWAEIAGNTDDLYGAKSAFYLAQSYMDGGDRAEARRHTQALIDSATPHTYWLARAFILLSDIYAADGKTFEAREYLNSLRENYPGTEADIFSLIDSRLEKLK